MIPMHWWHILNAPIHSIVVSPHVREFTNKPLHRSSWFYDIHLLRIFVSCILQNTIQHVLEHVKAWILMGSSTTLSLGSPTTPIRIEVLSYETTHTFMKWKLWEVWLRNPTANLQFWQGIQHFIQGFSHTQKEESENLKWQIWNDFHILFHPYSSMLIILHPFFIHPKTVQKYYGSQYMVILVSK